MRCLSLAAALVDLGADVEFVLSDEGPLDVIEGRGFSAIVLETDWRSLIEGVEVLCSLCDGERHPVVLVDTYSITSDYVDRLAAHANVCYLGSKNGDLGSLTLIANYSTNVDRECYERIYGDRGTKFLFGPDYAPLRPCFNEVYYKRSGFIDHVLVTTGNTDPHDFLPVFLSIALADNRLNSVSFAVVVGGMVTEEAVARITDIVCPEPRVQMLHAVSDMASLMERCDAAVSANGTTVYELAAAGLPMVTFAMVEEQVANAESLASLGAIEYGGLLGEEVSRTAEACVDRLAGLVSDPSRSRGLARCAHGLIDGLGAKRIAREMVSL